MNTENRKKKWSEHPPMEVKLIPYISIIILALSLSTCASRTDMFDLIDTDPRDNDSGNGGTPAELSLLDAVASSCHSIKVYFSNNVESSSAESKSNYSIPGLNIESVAQDKWDPTIVVISTSYHEDVNYTLTVQGVKDVFDNTIGANNTKSFGGDVAPYIKSVSSYSNKEVVVFFSEAVESTSAETKTNYSIEGLTAIVPTIDTEDPSKVTLKTSSQLNGTMYTITINNVADLNGNRIAVSSSKNFMGNGPVDSKAPVVLFAELVDDNTLEVQFSEPMDQISSQSTGNYTIKDNINNSLAITAATRQSDNSKVRLDIHRSFSQSLYVLTVSSNVMDLQLNELQGDPDNKVTFAGLGTIPENFTDGPVIVDPMGEGSNTFSMLVKYKGKIYVGPSGADNAMFRLKPDGSDPEIVSFIFHGTEDDTTTLNPGPDGEEGINYICGGSIGGTEYLFIGPYKTPNGSEIDYIYYTTDNGDTIEFENLYISDYLGWYTKSVSSIILFNGNLYIGFPNRYYGFGERKPFLIKLQSMDPMTCINLGACYMPRIGNRGGNSAEKLGIDSMIAYDDRLYIANGGFGSVDEDGGIVRSTTENPDAYNTSPGDWEDMTPVGSIDWYSSTTDRFSLELQKVEHLIPADKAFPAMVTYQGNLYVARNTTQGPQLWKYNGSTWTVVADNGSGLTTMGAHDNTSVTLLVVNGDRLYIGYDNTIGGVQIWRTEPGISEPASEADFEPVSVDGLGDAINNHRIYHGLSITDGGTAYLWVLCGKESGSMRIYRNSNEQ
jgi:hypothetical protein